MLRVFLLSVALSQAVLAIPNLLLDQDDIEREIENLERLLQEEEGNRAAEDLMDDEREFENLEEGKMMEQERALKLGPLSLVGLPAEQSTTHDPYTAAKAVDGNRNTWLYPYAECSHTLEEEFPWWKVDLGSEHCIRRVQILNRGDCCSDRLTGAVVRAGTRQDIPNPQCGRAVTSSEASELGGTITFVCNPSLKARYISVEIFNGGPLQLCEVTAEEIVGGECGGESTELSIVGRPTSQSSDYSQSSYKAELAADGNMGTILYPNNECTHTQEEINPWWKVALDGVHCITEVTLLNRGDCCSERLEGAVVRAGTSETILDNAVCGWPVSSGQAATLGDTIDIVCDRPLKATYISVEIPSNRVLTLCEVTVKEVTLGFC